MLKWLHAGCIEREAELRSVLKREEAKVKELEALCAQLQAVETQKNLAKPKRKYTKRSETKLSV